MGKVVGRACSDLDYSVWKINKIKWKIKQRKASATFRVTKIFVSFLKAFLKRLRMLVLKTLHK